MKGLEWFGFWIFLAVLAFGVTKCANDTYYPPEKTPLENCLSSCPKTSWEREYENLQCPQMCFDLVSKLTLNTTCLASNEGT